MPIYTYRCDNCGVQFDRRQKFSDEPLKVCPECQTETLRKVYLPVGIVFKGSGFYATDNRSPSGTDSRHPEDQISESSQDGEPEKKTKKEDKEEVKEN